MKQFGSIILFSLISSLCLAQNIITLEKALEIGLSQSYDIKEANFSLESSQKSLEAQKASLLTAVDLYFTLPSYTNSLQSRFNYQQQKEEYVKTELNKVDMNLRLSQPILFSNGNISVNGNLKWLGQNSSLAGYSKDYYSDLTVSLSQPLFQFNDLSYSLEQAEIGLKQAKRNHTRSERVLIYKIKQAYYRLVSATQKFEISKEQVKITEQSYLNAHNKYKAGLIPEVDALDFEVSLATAKNDLLDKERSLDEQKDDFKRLLGISMTDDFEVVADIKIIDFEVTLDSLIASALMKNPELLNQEDELTLTKLQWEKADSEGDISVELRAQYGINKNAPEHKDIFSDFNDSKFVALSLNVPVWDWGKTDLRAEVAEISLKRGELSFHERKMNLEKEVKSVYNKMQSAKARLNVLEKTVAIAQKSYSINTERYNSGSITSMEYSKTQQSLKEAKLNYLSAQIDYILSTAEIEELTYYEF